MWIVPGGSQQKQKKTHSALYMRNPPLFYLHARLDAMHKARQVGKERVTKPIFCTLCAESTAVIQNRRDRHARDGRR